MRRQADWFRQAELDLEAADHLHDQNRFEWSCFLCQQAGEKAVKALHESTGTEAWGHAVAGLLAGAGPAPEAVTEAAKRLDKHYVPTRYPNTHPEGAPGDLYTRQEADQALADAVTVIEHVRGRLPPP